MKLNIIIVLRVCLKWIGWFLNEAIAATTAATGDWEKPSTVPTVVLKLGRLASCGGMSKITAVIYIICLNCSDEIQLERRMAGGPYMAKYNGS